MKMRKTLTEDHKKRISEANLGVAKSESTKEAMRQAKLGTKQSPEHVARRMLAAKAKKLRTLALVKWCEENLSEEEIQDLISKGV